MMEKDYWRGHEVYMGDDGPRYVEDDVSIWDDNSRQCANCDRKDTVEGHDGCLGTLPGVSFACCGHGITNMAYIAFNDDRETVRGQEAIDMFREMGSDYGN